MFKRSVGGTLLVVLLLQSKSALGEPLKDIPPGSDKITPLHEGDKAPYSGQLFDNPTALRWANWLEQYRIRTTLDLELVKKQCAADVDALQARHQVVQGILERQIGQQALVIQQQRQQLEAPRPFYTTWWFGAVIGTVVTATGVGLLAYAVNR